MTDNYERTGILLQQVLNRSEYVYFLSRHVREVCVRVGAGVFLLRLDSQSGEVSLQLCEGSQIQPSFYVDCNESALESAVKEGTAVSGLTIRTGPMGQIMHPRVEQLLLRCFQPPPYPLDDREELIYSALFGFAPPHVLWESPQATLRVLEYEDSTHRSFCVSSGLTEPWIWQPAEIYDSSVSGAGYELVIKSGDPRVRREFASWVQYVEESQSHILPGNWLEFQGGNLIPGTKVAGFLVVQPTTFLPHFPIAASLAYWHALIPVTTPQLELAKRSDVFEVAKQLDN